jgi:hypothetical protein
MEAYPFNSYEFDYYDDLTLEQNIKISLILLILAFMIYLKFIFFN